jgi:CRP/FNR family transcriptional regulator
MAIETISALRATALFGALGDPELTALARRALEQRLRKGEILFLSGDTPRGLYVVVEGSVRAYRVGSDGREQVIHVEKAGATVGEVPMFDEGKYPSTVAGEEDSVLLFIGRDDFHRLLLEQPRIAQAALKVLATRLRNCASLVETLSLHDVDRRLARLILLEARTRGRPTGRGMEVEYTLTHQQVASRIGSVREVVSRAFSRLQQAGLVRVDGKTIVIPDAQLFADYVTGE